MDMTEQKNDFGVGSVEQNIIRMAVPMTVAQILNLLYNLVDRMYIGHIPGASSLALTGVGITFPIISMITAFANLFGMGGAPLCSMARGRRDYDAAKRYMQNAFWMLLAAGVVLTVTGYVIEKPLLYALGASSVTYPYASSYLRIYLLGNMFVMVGIGMNPFINAQGFGTMGMVTVGLGALVNIILDPLFIFVFHMGVEGAAIATIIAQFLSALWVLFFLTGEKPDLRLKICWRKPEFTVVKEIVSLGLSNFFMLFTNSLVQVVCNRQLQLYGGDLYVGVMTVLISVRDVATMVVNGITSGAQPVISFNYGAQKKDRVKQGIRFMVTICSIYTCLMWIMTLTFPEAFIRLFNSDVELVAAAVPSMHLYFFGFCFMALQFTGQASFQALGEAKYAIFFSIFRKVIIVVPLTILLPMIPALGLNGVFIAEPVSNLVGGCASFFTMLYVIWFHKLKED